MRRIGPRQILSESAKFRRTFEANRRTGIQTERYVWNQSKFMRFVLACCGWERRGDDDNGVRSGINLLNSVNSHRCHSPPGPPPAAWRSYIVCGWFSSCVSYLYTDQLSLSLSRT